ncbi:MAG TPA: hypothetical protein VL971_08425, partial [Rhizomicrobium sp.]|nr:hypothetical protein [Rhizomicrobium sp.]
MSKNTAGISEVDMVVPALRFAASKPDGRIATRDLIKALFDLFKPTGSDLDILNKRKDTHF